MAFAKVCLLDDLWQGEIMAAVAGDRHVLLIHTDDGTIVATQAVCPHQEAELSEGELCGRILTCRMHLWQFDVVTGKGVNPTHAELAQYPVKIHDGTVYVETDGIEPKFAHS